MIASPPGRRALAPIAVATSLLLVYGATLARDVTFWDAGEFIAAAADFGIPHPPGTPLYVLLLRAALLATEPLGVPPAAATSLVSALCTAVACAAGAALLQRATGDRLGAFAGGIAAGTMASVWLNASETEVYAASLAMSLVTVWAAERAGRLQSFRWTLLTGYLVVLAVPLHLSALLAAPAVVYLAAGVAPRGRDDLLRALLVLASVVAAYAIGRVSLAAASIAAVVLLGGVAGVARLQAPDDRIESGDASRRLAVARALAPALVIAIAASALLVLLLRARHDPGVNQGDPSTWAALADVVARRQYAVAAPWPRLAPFWLQLANVAHYADWQVALALGPTIFPTPLRTATTLGFVALAVYGARVHWRHDRRTALAFALLLVAGTLGAAVYLNLRAGPSFGHGVLPPGAMREARERDYFFVLGWWAWGMWAGSGAVAVARRLGAPGWPGLAGALVPLALNWRAVDRTRLPEAALPRATAEGLLGYAPLNAVLFVAGDNDSYPLWYAQRALGMRRDVTVITTPLLPADWYRLELARRHRLFRGGGVPPWEGRDAAIREIAHRARAAGRPVAMAVSMPAGDRALAGASWVLSGPVFVETSRSQAVSDEVPIDTTRAIAWVARLDSLTDGGEPRPSLDGTARYMHALLRCPATALASRRAGLGVTELDSLAPRCNFR